MSDRVKELTQKKLQNLTVSTFHAFGVKILRSDIERLGYRENFSIYDETDRTALIKECGRELKFSPDALDIYKISTLFSNIKTGRKNQIRVQLSDIGHPIVGDKKYGCKNLYIKNKYNSYRGQG